MFQRIYNNMKNQTLEEMTEILAKLTWSEEFDFKKITELLIKRNKLLLRKKIPSFQKTSKPYQNYCEFLGERTRIPLQFRAYHSGPFKQIELIHRKREQEDEVDVPTNSHVFFTLNLGEAVSEYILPLSYGYRALYVIDIRKLKNTRIQNDYSSEVIWNDRLRTLRDCYRDPEFIEILLSFPKSRDIEYIQPFLDKSKEVLKEAILEEARTWLERYTEPFNISDLQEYKNKKFSYLLVPSPISVGYQRL